MMNDGSFQSANATSFNLAEIWPFPINAAGCASGGQSGGKLDSLRRFQFEHSLGQFADNANRDVSIDDPMILEDQRGTNNGGGTRKRGEEDGSAKGVSTSCSAGNAMVFHQIPNYRSCY